MRLPRPLSAVVFDMDGLLFDTEKLYQEAIMAAAAEVGCEVTPASFLAMVGTPWHVTRDRLMNEHGAAFPIEELRAAWICHFDSMLGDRLALKPGVLELLEVLDALKLPRAIATSSSHRTVQHHLSAHDLVARFQGIVAHGDYEAGKPAPDPFLKAAERLGVDPRFCLALEDSHNGVRSAAAAGMMTIMVPDLLEPTQEIRGLCTFVVPNLHEVRRLVEDCPASAPV